MIDSLELPVKSAADKKKKAEEIGNRLTKLEKQLYNSNSGYGKKTAKHELAHALADKNGEGRFRLIYDKEFNDIVPAYETLGKIRSPKKRMRMAAAPLDMSEGDKLIYERAKIELRQQRVKAAIITSLIASPFICNGLIHLASSIK